MLRISYIECCSLSIALVLLCWIAIGNVWADIYTRAGAWLSLIVLFVVLHCTLAHAGFFVKFIPQRFKRLISPLTVGGAIVLAFAILVSAGISGASFELGYRQSSFLEPKPVHILGSAKPVRSDEWAVFTPMALGQATHHPSFPVVNHNLGLDGQNMLVVGMIGMPVAHISALAKPATWGFFFLDQRRALAWYWWFPVFGCLLALWGLFSLLIPQHWRLSLALATWFCLSPYPAAWSYWPAYAVFFPSLALCSLILILRGQTPWRLLVLILALGLSFAGFVFILYPPWQLPLAYLYLLLLIGLVVRDRLYRNFDVPRLAALGCATAITGVLVWWWWADARPAVQLMLNTVYPGQNFQIGGRMSVPMLLRGITNIVSLYRLNCAGINQSEVASFVYLFVPLLAAMFFNHCATRSARVFQSAILVFVGFTLTFMLVGVPQSIAKWSLWGFASEGRADLALGLAYVILCGLVLANRKVAVDASWRRQSFVYLIALVWAVFMVYVFRWLPNNAWFGLSPGVEAVLLVAVFLCGVWLIKGDARKFIAMNIVWSALTVLAFNPLVRAPKEVRVAPQLQNDLQPFKSASPNRPRVLVLDRQIPAMYLLAAGVPVANGVFYYPQPTFWARLDPDKKQSDIYNRFHHLIFTAGDVNAPSGVHAETPHPDVVRLVVAPERFRFSMTGAQLVAAPIEHEAKLKQNSSLTFIRREGEWSWFRVRQSL